MRRRCCCKENQEFLCVPSPAAFWQGRYKEVAINLEVQGRNTCTQLPNSWQDRCSGLNNTFIMPLGNPRTKFGCLFVNGFAEYVIDVSSNIGSTCSTLFGGDIVINYQGLFVIVGCGTIDDPFVEVSLGYSFTSNSAGGGCPTMARRRINLPTQLSNIVTGELTPAQHTATNPIFCDVVRASYAFIG